MTGDATRPEPEPPATDPAGVERDVLLHLVSPASGDLVELLARIVVAQLVDVRVKRRIWQMVQGPAEIEKVVLGIETSGGFVLHTLLDPEMRQLLEGACRRLDVPCLFVLEPFVAPIAAHFGATVRYRKSPRVVMDEAYARRVEAMRYTLSHDDGIGLVELEKADVVVLGASRVAKTPTCMYLAYQGIKAANVSLVPGAPLPAAVIEARRPLRVGLTMAPAELAKIRRERSNKLRLVGDGAYAGDEAVAAEVMEIRRAMARRGWPVIDVTHRSIDETAHLIMDLLARHQPGPG